MFAQLVLLTAMALTPGAPAAQGHCVRALSALAADTVPMAADFAAAECPRVRPEAAFRYDKMLSSSRLSRPIAQDEIVPFFPEFGVKVVQPGQKLRMVILAGAVRIERLVEVLQTARPGQKLFVRSSDGKVLSARYEDLP